MSAVEGVISHNSYPAYRNDERGAESPQLVQVGDNLIATLPPQAPKDEHKKRCSCGCDNTVQADFTGVMHESLCCIQMYHIP